MRQSLKLLLVLGATYWLAGAAARAQENIDEGKSATQLFAGSCAECHHNARGLAKGRIRPTLFLFLQDHYTASAGAAWELSAYLASVDIPQSSRTAKPKRPPKPVPSDKSN